VVCSCLEGFILAEISDQEVSFRCSGHLIYNKSTCRLPSPCPVLFMFYGSSQPNLFGDFFPNKISKIHVGRVLSPNESSTCSTCQGRHSLSTLLDMLALT
jgi:hypothetical protein